MNFRMGFSARLSRRDVAEVLGFDMACSVLDGQEACDQTPQISALGD